MAAAVLQQSSHSEAEVLQIASDEIARLGLSGSLMLLDDAGEQLLLPVVVRSNQLPGVAKALELTELQGAAVPLALLEPGREALATGRIVFRNDIRELAGNVLSYLISDLSVTSAQTVAPEPVPAIFSPLVTDGHRYGLLCLIGHGLTVEDVSLIEAFANLIATALANARLMNAMRQAEIQYRRLFESANDGIMLIDPDSEFILSANHKLAEMSGYSATTLLKMSASDLHPPECRSTAQQMFNQVCTQGDGVFDLPLLRADGEQLMVQFSATLFDAGGRRLLQSVVRDVTERVRAKEDLRESEQRYRNLFMAAQRQSQELSLLEQARRTLAHKLELTEVIQTVVEAIARTFGYTQVSLYLLEDDVLKLQHQVGYTTVIAEIPISDGVMGRVVRTASPALLEDVRSEPAFLGAIEGITSEVCVPLYDQGQVVGTLNVESTGGVRLSAADLRLMSALSEHISIAIARARLFEERRENEANFRLLFLNHPHAMWVYDLETLRFLEVNETAVAHYGYTREEFLTMRVTDIEPAGNRAVPGVDDREPFHRPFAGQQRHCRKDGSAIDVEVVSHRLTFAEREAALVVAQDITERVRSEQLQSALYRIAAVANSDVSLDSLYRSIHEIIDELMDARNFYIALYDPDEDLLKLPYFVDELDKYPGPYKPGKGLTEYIIRSGEPLLIDEAQHNALIQQGEVELVGVPSPIWLGVPLKASGTVFGAAVVQHYSDIHAYTEREKQVLTFVSGQIAAVIQRKHVEAALRESEERYRSFIEHSSEGIWRFELERPVVITSSTEEQIEHLYQYAYLAECNDTMAQMYGFDRAEEIQGARLADLLVRSDPENTAFLQAFIESDYRLADALTVEQDKYGNTKYIQNNLIGIVENGHLIRAWGMQRDVTEQKRAEEALRQAQKMESLGVLAGGIAHDFNNLLVAMLGQSSLALAQLAPENPARTSVTKVVKAAERAADLTRQLLAYSGRGQFETRLIQLNSLIQENLHLFEVTIPKNVMLHSRLNEPQPSIEADVGQIQQVIMNLILNAAESIGQRPGHVTVTTACEHVRADDSQFWQHSSQPPAPGLYVTLSVEDNGHGMDDSTLSRIFDPFFTTKFTGRGLGLAAVLGIVRGHKGGLQVESQAGVGTRFKLFFPAVASAEPASGPETASKAEKQRGLILIIDDEQPVCEAVRDILSLVGLEALSALGGAAGLELYRQKRDEIQLVLLDLSMPGMSGEETLVGLRQIDPDVRVVLSSGYSQTEVSRRFGAEEVTEFLQKPYTAGALLELVRRHVTFS